MSAAVFVPSPSTLIPTFINLDDPRVNSEVTDDNPGGDAYAEPPAYKGLIFDAATGKWKVRPDLDPKMNADTAAVSQALLDADMIGKANSLVGCSRIIRQGPYCEKGDHVVPWVIRCGLNLLCRDCGSGQNRLAKMRHSHRNAYRMIVDNDLKLLKFTIPMNAIALNATEILARRRFANRAFAKFRRKLEARKGYHGNYAMQEFDILDPQALYVSFYVIYISDTVEFPSDYRALWNASAPAGSRVSLQSCKGALTPEVYPSTRASRSRMSSETALKVALSGLEPVLRLPAPERIAYAVAFHRIPLSTPYGRLRGLGSEGHAKKTEYCIGQSDPGDRTDPAPHGFCPQHVELPLKFDPTAPLRTRSEFQQAWPKANFSFGHRRSNVSYMSETSGDPFGALVCDSSSPRYGPN